MRFSLILAMIWAFLLTACGGGGSGGEAEETSTPMLQNTLLNKAAYIPSQCYTQTVDPQGAVHNPCFTCHQASQAPNYFSDEDLQTEYSFAEYALTNHWTNLFTDRTAQVAAIRDAEIEQYIRVDNYRDGDTLILAEKLKNLPPEWDYHGDGQWDGFMPDGYFDFDEFGFDHAPDGAFTGWRAFGYHLFPGTFWPANGSTDDVLIRLPEAFRQDANGQFDLGTYRINLAIVEALIKRANVAIEPVDENRFGVDLNRNGMLDQAQAIVLDHAPLEGRVMSYVGQAKEELEADRQKLAVGLFPIGTEFLHSVRYLDWDDANQVQLSARMKELRYARKASWRTYYQWRVEADDERKEKDAFPDRLRQIRGNLEVGVENGTGWLYQGFIEDANGDLRPQTYEENVFCIGCHSRMGTLDDGVVSFSRKFDADQAFQRGWYHWSQKGLKNTPEPKRGDGEYEYTYYLIQNGAGDEFRANTEIMENFFDEAGTPRADPLEALHQDVTTLIWPSRERAFQLNKAYRVLVQEQSFRHGRDATITPPENVQRVIAPDTVTGVTEPLTGP